MLQDGQINPANYGPLKSAQVVKVTRRLQCRDVQKGAIKMSLILHLNGAQNCMHLHFN